MRAMVKIILGVLFLGMMGQGAVAQVNLLLNADWIASASEKQIIKQIEKGTDLNQIDSRTGLTPLIYLIEVRGNWAQKPNSANRLVTIMLERDADPNLRAGDPQDKNFSTDWAGITPLYLAVAHGLAPMVETLLKAGADPNVPARFQNRSPLMLAVVLGADENINIVRMLLEAGADPDLADASGETPLTLTAGQVGDKCTTCTRSHANPDVHELLIQYRN